jgi:hypothetical protein
MKKLLLFGLLLSGLRVIVACEGRKLTLPASPGQRPPSYQLSKVAHSQNVLLKTATYSGVLLHTTTPPSGIVHRGLALRGLTPTEVIAAELILTRCTQQGQVRWYRQGWQHADTTQQHIAGAIHPLSYYHRQYRGFSTAGGQRIVWINAFPKDDPAPPFLPDWRTREVLVEDGGRSYFNIYINLDTQQCFNFFRNSIGG